MISVDHKFVEGLLPPAWGETTSICDLLNLDINSVGDSE